MDAKERVTLRRVLQSIAERVKAIAEKLTGAESRILLKDADNLLTLAKEMNKALNDAGENVRTQKNTADSGVRYHAKQSDKNPNYLDATTVTEKDVMSLIIDAANGVYNNKAYIPVRISTPGIIQERLFVENLPMVMPVKKIKQALKADDGVQKGNNRRGHGFSESDIIEIIKRIDEPDYLFSQPANDRGIAVINYSFDSDSTIIIVEFGCNINPAYLSGFEGGTYNLAISMFDIDGGVVGLFEYAKSNNWVEVFNKEKEGNPAKKFPTIKPFAVEQDTLTNNISNLNEDVKKNSYGDADAEYLSAVESGEMETAGENVGTQKNTADSGVRNSFVMPFVDNAGNQYDNAVLLDTNFFNGLSTYNWGKKLRKYVEDRSVNNPAIMPILYATKGKIKKVGQTNVNSLKIKGSRSYSNSMGSITDVDENVKKNSFSDIDAEITKSAEKHFGVTYSWKETGYILTNGKKLDFSGKHNGARGGYRIVDHRESLEAYDESAQDEMSGAEAMVDFMQKGNIRVSPETDGINVSVLPTKAQETTL